MIDKELGYTLETHELIQRMCRVNERQELFLDKEKAEELALQTYDLFGLDRPNKVVWCIDIFQEKFRSANSVRSANSASSANSVRSASSANSAWSARSARSAIDYDFDWFVYAHECLYQFNENVPNKNDDLFLEYSEKLLQAKEHGLGYWVEDGDTLYLTPVALVTMDDNQQYHSEDKAATRWEGGRHTYFLHGVRFEQELWEKIVNRTLTEKEFFAIEDVDQRTQALAYMGHDFIIKHTKGKLIDEYKKYYIETKQGYILTDKDNPLAKTNTYKLYKLPKGDVFSEDAYYCLFDCPSTGKWHFEGVEVSKTVPEAMAWAMYIEPEEWKGLVPLEHET